MVPALYRSRRRESRGNVSRNRMLAGHMIQWRFSLLSLCTGIILGGVPLVATETGKLDPWSACCLVVGMLIGLTVGSLVERLRRKA